MYLPVYIYTRTYKCYSQNHPEQSSKYSFKKKEYPYSDYKNDNFLYRAIKRLNLSY